MATKVIPKFWVEREFRIQSPFKDPTIFRAYHGDEERIFLEYAEGCDPSFLVEKFRELLFDAPEKASQFSTMQEPEYVCVFKIFVYIFREVTTALRPFINEILYLEA